MRLLMIAPPGAGKGTQAELIAARYGIAHLSSGELLRREVAAGSPIGREAAVYLERGDLVPDDLVLSVLGGPLMEAAKSGGYVLDGFPRTRAQAEEAYRMARQVSGVELQAVIHLRVRRSELRRRLLERARVEERIDDTPEVIDHRLHVYETETAPILDFYGGRGLVIDVDGEGTVDEVFDSIVAALEPLRAGLA
ncbi:MAG TPA: adenylate kinase [Acidimicrobiales bacterium]|nr:adenylate kinase [Acidimicrobiales bacterium]